MHGLRLVHPVVVGQVTLRLFDVVRQRQPVVERLRTLEESLERDIDRIRQQVLEMSSLAERALRDGVAALRQQAERPGPPGSPGA